MHWLTAVGSEPLWAWFSLRWSMDLGIGLPMHYDVKLIKTSHATQDGRRKNTKCRQQVGRLLTCGSGIHEEMFWGAIGNSKERCKRTRKRTVINPLTNVLSSHKSMTTGRAGGMRKAPKWGLVGDVKSYSNNSRCWSRSSLSWSWMYF